LFKSVILAWVVLIQVVRCGTVFGGFMSNYGTLRRKFIVFYIGFALIPLGLLFFLFSQYDRGDYQIAVSRLHLGSLILLVGVASLMGFFAMEKTLSKVMLLTENIRKSMLGKQADKSLIHEFMNEDGEVAELAKSFNGIIEKLEGNIAELEQTKDKLHQVLAKIGKALTSKEDYHSLIRLVLETTINALGARDGAVFMLSEKGKYELEALVSAPQLSEPDAEELLAHYLAIIRDKETPIVLASQAVPGVDAPPFSEPLVCAPLISRGKPWGAVVIAGKIDGKEFNDDELSIVRNLSYQIAIAFENIRLSKDSEQTYFETISALALAVEARDPYSRGHSERVSCWSVQVGEELGLSAKDLKTIRDASRLHDVGKIGVLDSILRKNGKLTSDEYESMKRHPVIGESIVSPLKTLGHLIDPIRHHHERLNGSGYPDGLRDEEISEITRIIMAVDAYDAIASDRPYRGAMSWDKIKPEFIMEVETGRMDPRVVNVLIDLVESGRLAVPPPVPDHMAAATAAA
jgi:hypothetical protein